MKETKIRNNPDIDKIYDNVIYIVSALLCDISALLGILIYAMLTTILYPADASIKILGIMIISINQEPIRCLLEYHASTGPFLIFGRGDD